MRKYILTFAPFIIYITLATINKPSLVILAGGFFYLLYPIGVKKYGLNLHYPILIVVIFHLLILSIGIYLKGTEKTNFIGNFYIIYIIISYYIGDYVFNKCSVRSLKYISFCVFSTLTVFLSRTMPVIIENHLFFNSFTGHFDKNIDTSKINLIQAQDKEVVKFSGFKNKIIVIDFWNNNCGVCLEKFKVLNNIISKGEIDENLVEVISVNVYKNESEINKGVELFKEQKLLFKNYFLGKSYADFFEIKGYPTTIVIKDGKIVFKGTLETLMLFDQYYLK